MDNIEEIEAIDGEEKSVSQKEKEVLEDAGVASEEEDNMVTIDMTTTPDNEEEKEPENNNQEEKQPEVESQENKELELEGVLSFISKQTGREISSLDDLIQEKEIVKEIQAELDPEIEKYLQYKNETGRTMSDYIKLNKDYNDVPTDRLIAEYMADTNPHLDSEDIQFKMNQMFSFDEDDEDDVVRDRKIKKKEYAANAVKYFDDQKEKYSTPLGSSDGRFSKEEVEEFNQWKQTREQSVQSENDKLEDQKRRSQVFSKKTEELFSNKFEGFEFNLGEDKNVVYKIENPNDIREANSNIQNFIKSHLDETGALKDAKDYHTSLFTAQHYNDVAKFFYELGQAEALEADIKEAKNIDMSTRKQAPDVKQSDDVVAMEAPKRRGGKLTIKSKRNKT